jgi:hypothetical protein
MTEFVPISDWTLADYSQLSIDASVAFFGRNVTDAYRQRGQPYVLRSKYGFLFDPIILNMITGTFGVLQFRLRVRVAYSGPSFNTPPIHTMAGNLDFGFLFQVRVATDTSGVVCASEDPGMSRYEVNGVFSRTSPVGLVQLSGLPSLVVTQPSEGRPDLSKFASLKVTGLIVGMARGTTNYSGSTTIGFSPPFPLPGISTQLNSPSTSYNLSQPHLIYNLIAYIQIKRPEDLLDAIRIEDAIEVSSAPPQHIEQLAPIEISRSRHRR